MRQCDRIRVRHMRRTAQWSQDLVTTLCDLGLDAYRDDDDFGGTGPAGRPNTKYILIDLFDYRRLDESTFVVHVYHHRVFITWFTIDYPASMSSRKGYGMPFANDGKHGILCVWGLDGYAPSDPGVTPAASAAHIGHLVSVATVREFEDLAALLPILPLATQAYAAWTEGRYLDTLVGCTGDYDRDALRAQALAEHDRALALDPGNAVYYVGRSMLLGKLARWADALADCERALDLIPDYAHAWYHQGVALRQLDRKDEALSAFNHALALNPYLESAWRDQIQLLEAFGHHAQAADARRQREVALEGIYY